MLKTDAELIIYNFNNNNEMDEKTINRFIKVASDKDISEEDRKVLHDKIAVVQYDSNTGLNAFKLSNFKK